MKAKCTVREGLFVEPCDSLISASEYGNPRGKQKGIYGWVLGNRSGPTRTMFGAKSGEHVEKGVMFNFCPFCGEKIDAPFAATASQPDHP